MFVPVVDIVVVILAGLFIHEQEEYTKRFEEDLKVVKGEQS